MIMTGHAVVVANAAHCMVTGPTVAPLPAANQRLPPGLAQKVFLAYPLKSASTLHA